VELGERVAQADGLRLGQRRVQLFDLHLGGLEPVLEIGRLMLHARILTDQRLDDDADLVRGGERGQAPIGLGQADGIAFLSLHMGAHQPQHGLRLAVELQGDIGVVARPSSQRAQRPAGRPVLPIKER